MKILLPLLLLLAGLLPQDKPSPSPSASPSASPAPKQEEIVATLVDFTGTVDVKRPEDKDWVPAAKNMKIPRAGELCTGTASTATLLFPGNLTIDIKPVTYLTIDEVLKFAGGMKTNVRLKFGSVDIDLKKSEVTAGLTVATPVSTTSISGSKGTITAWAQGGEQYVNLKVTSGRWTHGSLKSGVEQIFGPGDFTNHLAELSIDLDVKNERREFGLNPGFEGGFGGLNPFHDAITQPGALPFPPPPP